MGIVKALHPVILFVSAFINKDTLVSTAQVVDLDFTESKCNNVTSLKQTIYIEKQQEICR